MAAVATAGAVAALAASRQPAPLGASPSVTANRLQATPFLSLYATFGSNREARGLIPEHPLIIPNAPPGAVKR